MKKTAKTAIKWTIIYPVVLFLCIEISFRIVGYNSFYNDDYSIKSSPKNAFIGHSKFGIQLNPGRYTITINDKVNFVTNHERGNHRLTPGSIHPDAPDLLFLGCSFTYGYGVNDNENFPALIQAQFPEFNVRNSGVVGYGTVQSLMQLEEAIKISTVKTVLLNFSSFHFMRNTLSQNYRSNLKIGYERSSEDVNNNMKTARFPYKSSCGSKIKFQSWDSMYSNWFGREWFASINGMQSIYDKSRDDGIDQIAVTKCIIQEMATLCEANGIHFAVICLDSNAETKKLEKLLANVSWFNVNFHFGDKKVTNLPYDSHPNTLGHLLIAKRITPFLNALLNEK